MPIPSSRSIRPCKGGWHVDYDGAQVLLERLDWARAILSGGNAPTVLSQGQDESEYKTVNGKQVHRSQFAWVGDPKNKETWRLPIHDEAFVRAALARVHQAEYIPIKERRDVLAKISAVAKKLDIVPSDDRERKPVEKPTAVPALATAQQLPAVPGPDTGQAAAPAPAAKAGAEPVKPPHREIPEEQPGPAQPTSQEPIFSPSEDYRSVRFKGVRYTLTQNQAIMVRVLHQAYLRGHPDVDKLTLLRAIENETSEVRDSFRSSPLWKTLVVSRRRGAYRLDLPEHK